MMPSIVLLFACGAAPAIADQAATPQPATSAAPAAPGSTPDPALTARFTDFMTSILAGRLPPTGISDAVRSGLTPALLKQVDDSLSALGAFDSLRYVGVDSLQGYQRYHYIAVFANGTQPLMFVLDSKGDIAGFFKDAS
jgi:hypothetical protein